MKNRNYYIAILFLGVTALLSPQGSASPWQPGHGVHTGNIFSEYSPATTYVGIFPGYRAGYSTRSDRGGWTGSAFRQMSTRNNYRPGYFPGSYGNRYWNGYGYRGNYHRGSSAVPFFMINRGWGKSGFHRENLYTSRSFVEAWKDAEPAGGTTSSLDNSPLLARGMTAEEVVARIGSPLQQIRLEGREIWKYSSFSLVFDDGMLTELR